MLKAFRGCRDHQDSSGKTLPLIADANLPAELKTRGGTVWPGATRNLVGRFGPEKRGQTGVAPGHDVDFPASELFLVLDLGLCRCNDLRCLSARRDADQEVDRAFLNDGLTGRAFLAAQEVVVLG